MKLIDEIKGHLDNKQLGKKALATTLLTATILTSAACGPISNPVDINNPQDETTITNPNDNFPGIPGDNTTTTNDQIKAPEEIYEPSETPFEKIELPKPIEECTALDKLNNFAQNFLQDETAKLEFLTVENLLDTNKEIFTRLSMFCSSEKANLADGEFIEFSVDVSKDVYDSIKHPNNTPDTIYSYNIPEIASQKKSDPDVYNYKLNKLNICNDAISSNILESNYQTYTNTPQYISSAIDNCQKLLSNKHNTDISIDAIVVEKFEIPGNESVIVRLIDYDKKIIYTNGDYSTILPRDVLLTIYDSSFIDLLAGQKSLSITPSTDLQTFEEICNKLQSVHIHINNQSRER